MFTRKTLFLTILAIFLLAGCTGKNDQTVPVNLRTEYLKDPIGLDTSSPGLPGNIVEMRKTSQYQNTKYSWGLHRKT